MVRGDEVGETQVFAAFLLLTQQGNPLSSRFHHNVVSFAVGRKEFEECMDMIASVVALQPLLSFPSELLLFGLGLATHAPGVVEVQPVDVWHKFADAIGHFHCNA